MLYFYPNERLDIDGILGHDWLKGPIASAEEISA
jgi:hypothetical protein